jgi:hypothetical protein
VLVLCRWARRSGRERLLALVRSIVEGKVVGRLRSVSVSHAKRSNTQRTDPARELMTSINALALLCKNGKGWVNLGLPAETSCHFLARFVAH